MRVGARSPGPPIEGAGRSVRLRQAPGPHGRRPFLGRSAAGQCERRPGEGDTMTITSRGAVAPTGDGAGTGDGTVAQGAPLHVAALGAIVDEVADHAVTWAKTGAAARADLLQQVITDTMAVEDDW